MADPLDPTNLLQLPQQIPTQTQPQPAEIAARYEYAKALRNNQMPVRHWTQGVSNMLNSLMGGYESGVGDNLGRQRQAFDINRTTPGLPPPANYNTGTPVGGNPYDSAPSNKSASQGGALGFASTGGSDDYMPRMKAATTELESGGNYKEVGPPTKYGRALGRYQIMPENVRNWSSEFLGKKLTPQQFLNDPAAQDAIYEGKMRQYVEKYGPEGAFRAWHGGPGGVTNPTGRDVLGTVTADYARKGMRLFGEGGSPTDASGGPVMAASRGEGGRGSMPALAFNGQPADLGPVGGAPDGQQAIALALRGGGPTGSPVGGVKPLPGPQIAQAPLVGGAPPNAILPGQSRFNQQGLSELLNSNSADPALKAWALQMYMGTQVNPRVIPAPGGNWYISADGKTKWYQPDLQKGKAKVGTIEEDEFSTIGPDGTRTINPTQVPGQAPITAPRAAPPPAQPPAPQPNIKMMPVVPNNGAPGGSGVLPQPGPQGALPGMPAMAATPPVEPPVQPPVRLAAANPTGTVSDAPPIGAAPPMGVVAPPLPTTPPPATPPGTQTAQFGPPTGQFSLPNQPPPAPSIQGAIPPAPQGAIRPALFDKYRQLEEYNQGLAIQKDQTEKAFQQQLDIDKTKQLTPIEVAKSSEINQRDIANKKYGTMSAQALSAGEFLPQLRLAQNLAANKDNPQGLFAQPRMFYHRVLSELGKDTGNEAALGQVFTKVISSSILDSLRAFTQGASVGQIRTMEITLAKLSQAGLENTPEANQVLLNLAVKSHERLIKIADMAADYQKEHGWLDTGWDKHVFNWQKENPLMTPAEEKDFTKLFVEGKGQTAAPAATPVVAPPTSGAVRPPLSDIFGK